MQSNVQKVEPLGFLGFFPSYRINKGPLKDIHRVLLDQLLNVHYMHIFGNVHTVASTCICKGIYHRL